MKPDPVEAYHNAWQAERFPDLFAFLPAWPNLSDEEIVHLVRIDQQRRWLNGDPILAEFYFERLPRLASREEDALVLLCGEFRLALESGRNPRMESYQARFPQWATRLEMQLALESALCMTLPMASVEFEGLTVPTGYEIIEKIGSGGMGVVYRARKIAFDKLVAIKVLHGTQVASPEQELTLRLEGQLIARLDHPGIVRVYDFDTCQGQPYLVMELTEGGNLAGLLKAGSPALPRAVAILEQLAQAVHHAHQRGVIHRDIKPANVLLTREEGVVGVAKLADFGLARIQCKNLGSGQIAGTPPYMSPEQARSESATAASDIWALGTVFYELLTGKPAFSGTTVSGILEQVCTSEPEPVRLVNPSVPLDLEAICRRCLQKDPARRYTSAAALAQDLAAWRAGRPVSARPQGLVERTGRWLRRHPGAAFSLAALLGLLGAFILIGRQLHDRVEQTRVEGLVEALCRAEPSEWPRYLLEVDRQRGRAEPLLRDRLSEPGQQFPAALALLPGDASQVDFLLGQVPTARPECIPVLRATLRPHHERIAPTLWGWLTTNGPLPLRLRAACLLATEQRTDPRWSELAPILVEALLQENPLHLGRWQEELAPVGVALIPELSARLLKLPAGSVAESLTTSLLVHWASGQPETLGRLLPQVDGQPFAQMLAATRTQPECGIETLLHYLNEAGHSDRCRARAAIALHHLGRCDSLPPLLERRMPPGLRSELIHRVAPLGIDPATLAPLLKPGNDSIRRAVVLALGEFAPEEVTAAHPWLLPWLLDRYEKGPDSGLHSAIGWLLRWPWKGLKLPPRLAEIDHTLALNPPADRHWWTSPLGELFVQVEGKTFAMGTPPGEQHRTDSPVHSRTIPRTYLLSSGEVSVASFQVFLDAHPKLVHLPAEEYSPHASGPIIAISWYQAAAYCNWRSEQERLPRSEWCYLANANGEYGPGMRPAPNALSRRGYRLPTEAEWEFACRAGTMTRFPHGKSPDLMGQYAWFQGNADGHAWQTGRLKPNDFGLFDMLGNSWEWCHEPYRPYPTGSSEDGDDDDEVRDSRARILRGGSYVERLGLMHPGLRYPYPPDGKDCSVGFRLARTWR